MALIQQTSAVNLISKTKKARRSALTTDGTLDVTSLSVVHLSDLPASPVEQFVIFVKTDTITVGFYAMVHGHATFFVRLVVLLAIQ